MVTCTTPPFRAAVRLNSGVTRIEMTKSPTLLSATLLAAFAGGCSSTDITVSEDFQPAQGWILVTHGGIADIKAAIEEYDTLSKEVHRGFFRVELHPQSNGAVAVVLPDGFPAYDLANLTGWLSGPPAQENVHGSSSWITSPGSGAKYYLEPEASNPWGDTLIGADTKGMPVRVYLPETGLSEISASFSYKRPPQIEVSPQPVKIEISLDTITTFGNPKFVINRPKDHDWQP